MFVCGAVYFAWFVTACLNLVLIAFLAVGFFGVLQAMNRSRTTADRRNFLLLGIFFFGMVAATIAYFESVDRGLIFAPEIDRATEEFQRTLRSDPRFAQINTYPALSRRELFVSGAVRTDEDRLALLRLVAKYQRRIPIVVEYVLIIDEGAQG
jgi:hypothetical protein